MDLDQLIKRLEEAAATKVGLGTTRHAERDDLVEAARLLRGLRDAKRDAAYLAWREADDAWYAELDRAFGKSAGDARYTAEGRGKPGTPLRQAYDRYRQAMERWNAVTPA